MKTSMAQSEIQWAGIFGRVLLAVVIAIPLAAPTFAQQIDAPDVKRGNISGTVMDANHVVFPGATVLLQGPAGQASRAAVADENGAFAFADVEAGGPYFVIIQSDGLVPWTSNAITIQPGQFAYLSDVAVRLEGGSTSVTVSASPEVIAAEQVHIEEKQRVLGIVPNFYVVYDQNPAPLTAKMKFALALKAETDPVVFIGTAMLSAMDQAGGTPSYPQGAKGYGQRFGANYATAFTDVMVGGAVLPSILHQDPRYFYQGTGTTRSRLSHALLSPFICKGDDGRLQPNYSSVGGDLASGAFSELYYPSADRGSHLVFQSALITTAGRMVNAVAQEFVLPRFTTNSRRAVQ